MKDDNAIAWRRVTVEGTVIVISILLAFAIDAWWEERNAREAEFEQLVRVAQELEANTKTLQRKLDVIVTSIEGTEQLISWMGPEPINVPPDVLHGHWPKFFSIGMYSVPRGAAQDYLAAGILRSSRHVAIRDAVSGWYSAADHLEKQYGLLRIAHARINDYAEDKIPSLHDVIGTGIVNQDLVSKFPYDQGALLSDPYFESRLATYLIRLEFVSSEINSLLDHQAELVSMIETTTSQ